MPSTEQEPACCSTDPNQYLRNGRPKSKFPHWRETKPICPRRCSLPSVEAVPPCAVVHEAQQGNMTRPRLSQCLPGAEEDLGARLSLWGILLFTSKSRDMFLASAALSGTTYFSFVVQQPQKQQRMLLGTISEAAVLV